MTRRDATGRTLATSRDRSPGVWMTNTQLWFTKIGGRGGSPIVLAPTSVSSAGLYLGRADIVRVVADDVSSSPPDDGKILVIFAVRVRSYVV